MYEAFPALQRQELVSETHLKETPNVWHRQQFPLIVRGFFFKE